MFKKKRLKALYERENEHLAMQEVGTEEYNASLQRLMAIEKLMHDPDDVKWIVDTSIKGAELLVAVVMPVFGLVWITATEKDCTFTGVLRDYAKYFFPKKRN